VGDLERMASTPAFAAIRDEIIALAGLKPAERLLDIGAGTGLLTLAAAARVQAVSALDVSQAMCAHLERKCSALEVENVEVLHGNAVELPLANDAIDVVLSNYCFHHLRDADKLRALAQIRRVLRPGGRLIFGDMMFRLGVAKRRDRAVIALLVRRVIAHGPAGLVRLAKNALRILTGRWERPASVEWWQNALRQCGFVEVAVYPLEHEGGIAFARKPLD
jgi:ubiquinone/menaquinone biosynthesis C-methylase UbiE